MLPIALSEKPLEQLLATGLIEFLDLGCGAGGSCEYVRRYTDMRVGLSLDLSHDKIAQCRNVNDLSFAFDVSKLPPVPDCVSAAVCMHFLEHIDDAATVFRIIEAALNATRDFLVVRQPYFDHDAELAKLGCKTYWSDWRGHKTKLTRPMIEELSLRLRAKGLLTDIGVSGIDRIDSTAHESILPLDAPPDQHFYVEEKHGPKPIAPIQFDCFREILLIFERSSISEVGLQRLAQIVATVGQRVTDLGRTSAQPSLLIA